MARAIIRKAKLRDAKEILEIYAHYIENTAITFECAVPTVEEFRERMRKTLLKYPYYVLTKDNKILGYTYAGAFVGRAAYDWSAEVTIYLSPNERGKGYGRQLYGALESALKEMGVLNLYACVGYPNTEDEYLTKNSAQFHKHLGYRQVGIFQNCEYKFQRWYSMIWMEKIIGEHTDHPDDVG